VSRSNTDGFKQTNSDPGFPADILVALDTSDRRGLREQLQQQLRSAIQQGRLPAGTPLPPTRTLARDLGVARSVVVDAYEQLEADGYIAGRQGSGTRVLPTARQEADRPRSADAPIHTVRLLGGLPDPALFPRAEWLRHYRAALGALPNDDLAYPGPLGALQLREALTNYLGRVRGVVVSPNRMLVSTGLTQAIVLLCRALRRRGVEAIAVEDPCFGLHREAIANTGLRVVPVPVDDAGIDVARLADLDVDAVLVAPAHSYPTGAVLSAERRTALVEWAHASDGLVIEDDYDAEFRYDRAPIGALQGLAPERVAYAGCVSKTLTPALRLGWMALPRWLIGDVMREKLFDDMGTSLLEQVALAGFIDAGALGRHLRRVRPIYRRRRDAVLESLAAALPGAQPKGIAAGLHVYVELPAWLDESALIEAAHAKGLLIGGGRGAWSDPSPPPALVLGYGAINEQAIRNGVAVLGSIYERLAGGS
jgi:GntR family transcriptional regulator/MocR family aminotransferase